MTNKPERALRRALLTLLACLALLTGCGPGTGGTGTGPNGAIHFSGTANVDVLPGPGANCVAGCDHARLRVEDARVELVLACSRFVFEGALSLNASGEAVLSGTLETGGQRIPATLRLRFSEGRIDSAQAAAALDGAGIDPVGPLTLQRSDGAGPPPACN